MKFTERHNMNEEDKKYVDDIMDEAEMKQAGSETEGLPESPASANVKVWIEDFGVMFTVRDNLMDNVVKKIETLIKVGKGKGWKPTWSDNGHSKPTTVSQETKLCKVHNVEMTKGVSKKSGKEYWIHKDGDKACFGRGWTE